MEIMTFDWLSNWRKKYISQFNAFYRYCCHFHWCATMSECKSFLPSPMIVFIDFDGKKRENSTAVQKVLCTVPTFNVKNTKIWKTIWNTKTKKMGKLREQRNAKIFRLTKGKKSGCTSFCLSARLHSLAWKIMILSGFIMKCARIRAVEIR